MELRSNTQVRSYSLFILLLFIVAGPAQAQLNKLHTANFGGQTWTNQNLNINTPGAVCFGNNNANCGISGYLYTFAAANKVCSSLGAGWRLPSDSDWLSLTRTYGRAYGDGGTGGTEVYKALGPQTEFNGSLGGKYLYFKDTGKYYFYDYHRIGYYWGADKDSNDRSRARIYTFRSDDRRVLREGAQPQNYNSVRCVKDNPLPISPEVPHDVTASGKAYPHVSQTDLARFAWSEFVALNYPANPNHRGQAAPNSSLGDAAPARVWESYWHKVEMFPYDEKPAHNNGVAIVTGKPTYKYDPKSFKFDGNYGGSGQGDSQLWNNLDENNELNVDKMFAHVSINNGKDTGFTDENRILYEAKMNEEGFNYILKNKLYVGTVRDSFAKTSKETSNLVSYGSYCGPAKPQVTQLPCGAVGGSEGNIEIKAAWRKLTSTEMRSGAYHTNSVMRYQGDASGRKWYVDTYGLVGLHIIHKTLNFPSYVYATFEHKGNLASGLGYIDEITQSNRGKGDVAGKKVVIIERDNPIPPAIAAVNTAVQEDIMNTVWANYELVGVQAYPIDYAALDSSRTDQSTYYLANLVIESNEELQNFRGLKAGDKPDQPNMYSHGKNLNMGGCMGCHGVAQLSGGDFNFLIKNSPFTSPEIVGNTGVISLRDINSFSDVQAMFNDYVNLNGIQIGASPHKKFWANLDYAKFISSCVPNVYGGASDPCITGDDGKPIQIVDCGDSENSAIIEILGGSYKGVREMPAGGPYFPEEQVEKFAKWVNAGCHQ